MLSSPSSHSFPNPFVYFFLFFVAGHVIYQVSALMPTNFQQSLSAVDLVQIPDSRIVHFADSIVLLDLVC